MCKQGEISNAIKDGRTWLIPDDITLKQLKPLPIGVSDFKSATTNYYYVDKTLMIRDFLDAKPMVSLFTRPRRFGKTLNMDMLRVFFENALFKDLVDICKNAIVILSISSVKINRHWQFNDISAYEWYLFHH
ncbi:AAA family ATPase [Bulleidia sp. HCP3S3_G12]